MNGPLSPVERPSPIPGLHIRECLEPGLWAVVANAQLLVELVLRVLDPVQVRVEQAEDVSVLEQDVVGKLPVEVVAMFVQGRELLPGARPAAFGRRTCVAE